MTKLNLFLSIFLVALLSCKQENEKRALSKKSQLLELFQEEGFNGNFLFAEKGEKKIEISLGYRDFESQDSLIQKHQFYLASVSKQFTGMACLLLVHEGKLDLDDKLSSFYPQLSYADSVSIRQMLHHSSGIPDYYGLGVYKPGMTNEDVLNALLNDTHLDFVPGTEFRYSNSAYVLLSLLAEKASGTTFSDLLEEKVFNPLGMNSTLVYDREKEMPARAIGYSEEGDKKDYHAFTTGGGGLFSNIPDLYTWERALYTDKLIPQDLMKEAYIPGKLAEPEMTKYGFGWFIDKDNPHRVWHSGSLEGFRNLMKRDMKDEILLLYLTNNSFGKLAELSEKVEAILFEEVKP
ncbi:MAG: serine hydrolase domain-containing protein [Bacteroidia bacterium]|nr:serine hydrolase domain-containing protein [Bacteroidia bacterium]